MSENGGFGPPPPGSGPDGPSVFRLTLSQVTSLLFFSFRKTVSVTGTPDTLDAFYRKVLTHNLLLGWWSVPGLIWNPLTLNRNRRARAQLRQLAGPGA